MQRQRGPAKSLHLAHVPNLSQAPRSDTGVHGHSHKALTRTSLAIHEELKAQEKKEKTKGMWKNMFTKTRKNSQAEKIIDLGRRMKEKEEEKKEIVGEDTGASDELAEKLKERRSTLNE